jgi:hypothetical protein
MKIAELRGIIDKYSNDQMKLIIAEMYKALPKQLKQESGIDKLIRNPDPSIHSRSKTKQIEAPDIDLLEFDIDDFIENAYNQFYFIPNRIVSRQERSKWRFVVKRFYKDLLAAAGSKEDLPVAAELLEKIYDVLCYSCSYIIFNSEDAFESIGITQPDFFRQILLLKHENDENKSFIKDTLLLLINTRLNRNTLHSDLMYVVMEFLKTPEMREMAVSECTALLEVIKMGPRPNKESWEYRNEEKEKTNLLAEMGFLCFAQLYEFENAVSYFNRHYLEASQEIKLYILLELLFRSNQKDLFLKEYDNSLKNGVRPRIELEKTYHFVKENGKFPEYFLS